MKRLSKQHIQSAIVGGACVIAIVGGAYAAKRLVFSGAAVTTAGGQYGVLQAQARSHPKRAVVPYVGPFTYKGCGPAIAELDRALIRKHFRTQRAAPCLGAVTRRQIAAFQRSIHYKPTGRYTLATHRQLVARGGYTFVARGRLIVFAHLRYVQAYRNAVVRIAAHVALVGGTSLIYSQGGSRGYFPAWPRIPPATDCSGTVIYIEYQAGAGAQVGYYGPGSIVGYTGTLAVQGLPVPFSAKLYPGDVILYGRFPFFHATIYIGNGLVLSHGGRGVKLLPFNYNGQVGSIRRMVA